MPAELMLKPCREIEHVKYVKEETTPSTLKTTAILKGGTGVSRGVIGCPLKRNGAMPMDEIASRYLDEILKNLEPLMTWKK